MVKSKVSYFIAKKFVFMCTFEVSIELMKNLFFFFGCSFFFFSGTEIENVHVKLSDLVKKREFHRIRMNNQ